MNRRDLQDLAVLRLREAKILLDHGLDDGAYYLCGYVVECALKACIAKQTRLHDFPPAPTAVRDMYTHNLEKQVGQAGLGLALRQGMDADSRFAVNWTTAKDWSEQSRYMRNDHARAEDMYRAVSDRCHGVLRWLKRHW